jgi:hypothetical protein
MEVHGVAGTGAVSGQVASKVGLHVGVLTDICSPGQYLLRRQRPVRSGPRHRGKVALQARVGALLQVHFRSLCAHMA